MIFFRGLPALTIHTAVKQAKKAFVNVKNPTVKAWGPTTVGLAILPALPFMFDHPVETATASVFDFIKVKLIDWDEKKGSKGKGDEL